MDVATVRRAAPAILGIVVAVCALLGSGTTVVWVAAIGGVLLGALFFFGPKPVTERSQARAQRRVE